MKEKKETWVLERPVEIDGKQSVISVKLDFDCEKGTCKITGSLNTKQLSENGDMQKAVLQQFANMTAEVYEAALKRTREWLETERPQVNDHTGDGQMTIVEAIDLAKDLENPNDKEEVDDTLPFTNDDDEEKEAQRAEKV